MLTYREIENLGAAELKAKLPELIKEFGELAEQSRMAGDLRPLALPELFERFVRARLDAKARDVALGEQGKTITALNLGAESLTAQLKEARDLIAQTSAEVARAMEKMAQADRAAADELGKLRQELATVRDRLNQTTIEAQAATRLAKARRDCLADLLKFAGDLSAKVAPLLAAE